MVRSRAQYAPGTADSKGPQLLRTGARVQVGEHVLVYQREEFADHGRPYGGRVGGELGRQAPQGPADPAAPQG